MANGGEVTGQRSQNVDEPVPYGMVEVKRGFLNVGLEKTDTLWGKNVPARAISVDGFWMDQTEVTNSMYREFVNYVRDSIIRERLADPAFGGDETYKIEVDRNGDPITPHLNWNKAIPWRKPGEDAERAIMSVFKRH
ncbi:MAG: SUMF1/EgtB/PvdO family nonheme iron enzyme, partial [Bacteroidaceae bacterium]|nr:SUMF1/EgtB/PvdO family nonheme iron enzyme [Bacteroidaceae bacterium]